MDSFFPCLSGITTGNLNLRQKSNQLRGLGKYVDVLKRDLLGNGRCRLLTVLAVVGSYTHHGGTRWAWLRHVGLQSI